MGRKRTRKEPLSRTQLEQGAHPQFNQSQQLNSDAYNMAYNQMLNIALSRFKWLNLPKTCDAWFLEYNLLYFGYATIAFPNSQKGIFYSTQAVTESNYNVYYRPRKWWSYGLNGWRFPVNNNNGVFVYSNSARTPLIPTIRFFAHEIEDLYMVRRQNRFHQKIPFILETPPAQENAAVQLLKEMSGGELAIMATNGFSDSMRAQVLQTGVKYIGEEVQQDIQNTWNNFYLALGISNIPVMKTERQTSTEIKTLNEPSDMRALSELNARREACDTLNTRFEKYLSEPIQVVWNEDNYSDNYNYWNNIERQMGADDDLA